MALAVSKPRRELNISFYRVGGGNWVFHVYPVVDGKPLDELNLTILVSPRKRRMILQAWNPYYDGKHVIVPYEDREREIPAIPFGSRVTRNDMLTAVRNYAKYLFSKYYGLEIP